MYEIRTYVRTCFWRPWSHDDEDGDDDDDDDGDDEAADANNEKKVGNFPRPAIGACTLVDVNYVRTCLLMAVASSRSMSAAWSWLMTRFVCIATESESDTSMLADCWRSTYVRTYVDIRRMSFTIRSEAADAAVIVLMCTLVQVSATRGKLLRN